MLRVCEFICKFICLICNIHRYKYICNICIHYRHTNSTVFSRFAAAFHAKLISTFFLRLAITNFTARWWGEDLHVEGAAVWGSSWQQIEKKN